MPSSGDILDGYTLIRPIGRGGFGEVWLCRSDSMRDWRALKFISIANENALDKEYEALMRYRKASAQLRSPHITPIEHVNRHKDGLFYIMPLADGGGAESPASEDWRPYTLGTYIAEKRTKSVWCTSEEIIALFVPVLRGLQCLADARLVHRDIKPDNILFFGGKACLGDISLMTADRSQVTRHGTPGYSTPSWFTGGHHDMYGAAATLYTLLTGNDPDKLGRSSFLFPPQGEASLSETERREWLRLHAVIRRAIDENPSERFTDFTAMASAVAGENVVAAKGAEAASRVFSWRHAVLTGVAGILGLGFLVWKGELFAAKHAPSKKTTDKHESLMNRLAPFLEANDRIGHDYDRKLKELLAFYEKTAPGAIAALEALSSGSPSPDDFESRLAAAAPKLKALIRPELSLRDDPRVPLPREEWFKRIAEAKKAKIAGQPEPLTTLADARADAWIQWGDAFESAGQCPQNPDEQFWFEKRVSSRFYASPLRAMRDFPPMEVRWFAKADNDGIMRPLSDGCLRKLLEQSLLVANRRAKEESWSPETVQRLATLFDGMMKSALWVEIQTGVFMKRENSKSSAPVAAVPEDLASGRESQVDAPATPAVSESQRQQFRAHLLSEIQTITASIRKALPTSRPKRTPMVEDVTKALARDQALRDETRPKLVALYRELSAKAAETPRPWPWQSAGNASEAESVALEQWRDAIRKELNVIQQHGADSAAMLAGNHVPFTDERYAFQWINALLYHDTDSGPSALPH